jgi:maleate isomerase
MPARIGLIIPSSNRMVEQEMLRFVPAGVQSHIARLRMTGPHRLSFERLLGQVEEAAMMLMDARCDAIAFHCTATSMEHGLEGEQHVLAALARAGAPHALTTATALRHAFEALAVRRVVLITPYTAETTQEEAMFLRAAGYDIIHAAGFALAGSDAYCATPAGFWRDRVMENMRTDADAYFVSCANIACLGVVDALEAQLGRPVITSNQAVLWDALRQIGWHDAVGPGRLFQAGAHRLLKHA